jgi:acyl-coenzyme A thioesterase PaaI-like protein
VTADPLADNLARIGTGATDEGAAPQVEHPAATAAAVQATRELVAALRVADADPAVLEEVARTAREATALLAPHRVEAMRMQGSLRPEQHGRGFESKVPAEIFPYSPVVGPLNPLAPPVEAHFDGERVHGTVTLGAAYVGPPQMVHGGVIALLFDEVLGIANVCHGVGAFTGTLTVRYERPTPLERPLQLESWVERAEGRKVITRGTISHDGEVTASAEGIFIQAQV